MQTYGPEPEPEGHSQAAKGGEQEDHQPVSVHDITGQRKDRLSHSHEGPQPQFEEAGAEDPATDAVPGADEPSAPTQTNHSYG